MKKLLTSLSLLALANVLLAQITVQRTDFSSIGDVFYTLTDPNVANLTPGGTGSQTWDFTSLAIANLDTINFEDPANMTFGTMFPDANLGFSSASLGEVYLDISTDSMVNVGVALDVLGNGAPFPFRMKPAQKIIEFPANLNDQYLVTTVVDTAIDTSILGIIDSVKIILTITSQREIDAYGTIDLPSGSYNTLRMKNVEATRQEIYLRNILLGWPSTPDVLTEDTLWQYQWMAKNEGFYVCEAEADSAGNIIRASYKAGAQVLGILDQQSNASCNGDCDGTATIKAFGGTGDYAYQWDANAGSGTATSVSNLCAGVYYYTITDNQNGSTFTDSVVITEPDTIAVSADNLVNETQFGNDGEIDISATGGTGTYTFSWDNGETTKDINSLVGGTYTVTVTDLNGCTQVASFTIGSAVGIGQSSNDRRLSLFPNPTEGEITIQSSAEIAKIKVYNILGTVVSEAKGEGSITLDVAPGVYFAEIQFSDGTEAVRKIEVR